MKLNAKPDFSTELPDSSIEANPQEPGSQSELAVSIYIFYIF